MRCVAASQRTDAVRNSSISDRFVAGVRFLSSMVLRLVLGLVVRRHLADLDQYTTQCIGPAGFEVARRLVDLGQSQGCILVLYAKASSGPSAGPPDAEKWQRGVRRSHRLFLVADGGGKLFDDRREGRKAVLALVLRPKLYKAMEWPVADADLEVSRALCLVCRH